MAKSKRNTRNSPSSEFLQALGYISLKHGELESLMVQLFLYHLITHEMPDKLARRLYGMLADTSKTLAIAEIFSTYEKDQAVTRCVKRLIEYYAGCSKLRNSLLHSHFRPPLFGAEAGYLYLAKHTRKTINLQYSKVSLEKIQYAVKAMQTGIDRAEYLLYHITIRDTPPAKRSLALRAVAVLGFAELPSIPRPPIGLRLKGTPYTPPMPAHLRRSSSQ